LAGSENQVELEHVARTALTCQHETNQR